MNTQGTKEYQSAWKAFAAADFNIDRLSAADRAALAILSRKAAEAVDADTFTDAVAVALSKALDGDTDELSVLRLRHSASPMLMDVVAMSAVFALCHECARLSAKVKALEAAPQLSDFYKGVWRQDVVYGQGSAVTHAGSLWIAKSASVSRRPGAGDGSWQLAVKSGAPGKDGQCRCAAGAKDPQ